MKITIKPLKLTNLNNIIRINVANLPENYPDSFWKEQYYNGANKHSFVAYDNSIIIGYIFCNGSQIISFAIESNYRNKKIGSHLLLNCLSTCTNNINLYCRLSNPALYLYKKNNFIIQNTIENYYRNPTEDGIYLEWIASKIDNTKRKITIN